MNVRATKASHTNVGKLADPRGELGAGRDLPMKARQLAELSMQVPDAFVWSTPPVFPAGQAQEQARAAPGEAE